MEVLLEGFHLRGFACGYRWHRWKIPPVNYHWQINTGRLTLADQLAGSSAVR